MADLLVISPGDTLLIKVPMRTDRETVSRIADAAKAAMPGVKIAIIGADEIFVYKQEPSKPVDLLKDDWAIVDADGLKSRLGVPKTFLDLRTPERWLETDFKGYEILDPDGWRGSRELAWNEPITREDFYNRMMLSTIQAPRKEETY